CAFTEGCDHPPRHPRFCARSQNWTGAGVSSHLFAGARRPLQTREPRVRRAGRRTQGSTQRVGIATLCVSLRRWSTRVTRRVVALGGLCDGREDPPAPHLRRTPPRPGVRATCRRWGDRENPLGALRLPLGAL